LPEVERWQTAGTVLGVIGHPVGHSVSPQMHTAALLELAGDDARFADWRYFPFDIVPERLPEALRLMHERGFLGINLTLPHKVLALGCVDGLDPAARDAGAVNTLLRDRGGWRGYNTDGYGLASGIRKDLGRDLRGSPIVLLGAGGAARAAAAECLAARCAGLWIVNRTRSNLETLISQVTPLSGGIPITGLGPGDTAAGLAPGAIVINATSAGLHERDPAPADLAAFPGVTAVYDMVYNPPRTRLLAQAEALGLSHANGLGMLVHQGAKSLEIWSGAPASRTAPAMRAAAAKALGY
jgi:shikimate dehydrogenase